MALQSRRQYTGKARKSKSRTHRAKDVRFGRRARTRTVNAPKRQF
jgi:hypothetical protein